MYRFILSFSLILIAMTALASELPVESVMLSDGTVHNGLIVETDENGMTTFHAETSIIPLEADRAQSIIKGIREVTHSELPHYLKQALYYGGNSTADAAHAASVLVGQISLAGDKPEEVVIIERGDKTWKYLRAEEKDVVFPTSDIDLITYSTPSDAAKSGLRDVIILDDYTELEGYMLEKAPGRYIKFESDGETFTIPAHLVLIRGKREINPSRPIMEQSRVVDKLWFKSGARLEGVIVEENFLNGTVTVWDIYRKMNRTRSLLDLEHHTRSRNPQANTFVW